ncbi:MAG: diaminopimelate decarboxylase family protein, partial [Alphaproteobacteria bacterium]
MNHFDYIDGELYAEAVPLARIADAVGTPFYCYSTATLERHYRRFAAAFADQNVRVCYALKANANLAVVRTLGDLGAGADVVSEGELRRALAAGIPAGRCVFSGVGKTAAEIAFALDAGILQFNVESEPELDLIARLAAERGQRAPVALRVNPDVAADTHHKIATGRREDKFGIDWNLIRPLYAHAAALPGVEIIGLAVHIGSQLVDLAPFRDAFTRLAGLVRELRAEGLAIRRLD